MLLGQVAINKQKKLDFFLTTTNKMQLFFIIYV